MLGRLASWESLGLNAEGNGWDTKAGSFVRGYQLSCLLGLKDGRFLGWAVG